jgi:hypothetical protein
VELDPDTRIHNKKASSKNMEQVLWPWAFRAVEVKLAYSILVFALTFPIKMPVRPAECKIENQLSHADQIFHFELRAQRVGESFFDYEYLREYEAEIGTA